MVRRSRSVRYDQMKQDDIEFLRQYRCKHLKRWLKKKQQKKRSGLRKFQLMYYGDPLHCIKCHKTFRNTKEHSEYLKERFRDKKESRAGR